MIRSFVLIYLLLLSASISVAQTNAPIKNSLQTIDSTALAPPLPKLDFVFNVPVFAPDTTNYKIELGNVISRKTANKTGLFFLSVVLLFIFSLVRLFFPKYFVSLFQVFTSFNVSKRHIKDQLEVDNRASICFYFIYFICSGFILFNYVIQSDRSLKLHNNLLLYCLCALIVVAAVVLKTILLKLVSWVFNDKDYSTQYLFTKRISNEFLGILLFPLCIIILLSSAKLKTNVLNTAIVLLILSVLYNYVKNIPLVRNLLRINFFHFLLYFCAFEIMPILILMKLVL